MNKFMKVSKETFVANGTYDEAVYSNIKLPTRATKSSMGYDFFAPDNITLKPGSNLTIPTGIKCQLDEDKGLFIFPRSGLGFKYKVHLANTVGLIDADYFNNKDNEGHIMIKICNGSTETITIKQGEAFAQGVILQYFKVDDEITPDKERQGGLGSTTEEKDSPNPPVRKTYNKTNKVSK